MSLFLYPRSINSITWSSRAVSVDRPSRPGSAAPATSLPSIHVPPEATVWRQFSNSHRGAVLRTTPAAPACRNRRASASDNDTLHTTVAMRDFPALNVRTHSITPLIPNARSTTTMSGCNCPAASAPSSRVFSAATTRMPSTESRRLRSPSMASGSVSQTTTVFTTVQLSAERLEYCSGGGRWPVAGGRGRARFLYLYRAQRKIRQVDPAVSRRALNKRGVIRLEYTLALELLPAAPGQFMHGRNLTWRNLLGQCYVRMVNEGFLKHQRLAIEGIVHGIQLLPARAQFDINHVRPREHLDLAQLHRKRPLARSERLHLLAGRLPVPGKRAWRQYTHVCMRIAPGNQLPAQIVQKPTQWVGNVYHQGVYVEPLLNPRQQPLRIGTHQLYGNHFVVFCTLAGNLGMRACYP